MELTKNPAKALDEAADRIGSRGLLARALGLSRQNVYQWSMTPTRHVLAIEKLTGVSRYDLRPDIYPREP